MTNDIDIFIQDVINMRIAQKQYFKTRDKSWLNRAKQAEVQIDKWLEGNYKQKGLNL